MYHHAVDRMRSKRARLISLFVALALVPSVGLRISAAAEPDLTTTVDLASVIQKTDAQALGVGSSTYGANPLSSAAQASAEKTLDARYVRIPVGYRNGRVTSSAGGTGGTLDVPALVSLYRSWGYRVLIVCGGRTNDVDIQPGDATRMMQALGFDGIDYTTPNEPGNQGKSIQDSITWANMIYNEGRALNPNFKVWGPVWAYYDRGTLTQFMNALGDKLGGIDYHHYAMGEKSLSTAQALSETARYGQEIREIKADLAARGLNIPVNVDELNFSWRYNDGTPGGNNRFFTSVNTVWMASAIGQVLQNGGRAMPYATQNGPLGVMVEAGNVNPDGRAPSSPMPAFWGIASWTGASAWPHYKDSFFKTDATDASGLIESYAVNNENAAGGSYSAYQSKPSAPYSQPTVTATGAYTTASPLLVSLPAMTVTVVVLKPGATATTAVPPTTATTAPPTTLPPTTRPPTTLPSTTVPTTTKVPTTLAPTTIAPTTAAPAPVITSAPTNFKAVVQGDSTKVVTSWNAPTSVNSSITGYRISRNGTDSTGGGAHVAQRKVVTFTLLKPNTTYTFTVRAVTATALWRLRRSRQQRQRRRTRAQGDATKSCNELEPACERRFIDHRLSHLT